MDKKGSEDMTDKQQRFIEEYLIDLNATQAAIRAGYSTKTAEQIGFQLLNKTSVSEEIKKKMAERSKRTGINADRVLDELAKIAFANAKDIINFEDASVRKGANEDDLACVQSVKVKKQTSDKGELEERQVTMYDKKAALELLGRHLGMWKDKVEVSGIDEEKSKLDNILNQMRVMGSE